ncbi:MAG TPA: tRNA (adenosine(37)-N6)-threonylcarbamoyltransferase complex dimerization subunit type 1 TsaB [Polyangia bacterium]|jgi:tRNA threonylcarbamoyladenosine biosynthesis protein TsaB
MDLLAIDTATLRGSVAVVRGTPGPDAPAVEILARRDALVTTHSEMLLGLIDGALRDAGVAVTALGAVACGAGPGSFTGLRIGLTTAKGLCFAAALPLVLGSSLRALALRAVPAAPDRLIVAVLDAKKGEVYGGFYRGPAAAPAAPEVAMSPAAFARHAAAVAAGAPVLLCGDGAATYAAELRAALPLASFAALAGASGAEDTPGAVEIGRLGLERLATDGPADLASAAPAYVRPSEAELKRPK